ncbi:glycosyltransferase family 39 protein [Candidatus Falkowbacteria bacterium]|nr:glycosyltransferase family 39 protein [Candidatus Falkowbacteria bacterium]
MKRRSLWGALLPEHWQILLAGAVFIGLYGLYALLRFVFLSWGDDSLPPDFGLSNRVLLAWMVVVFILYSAAYGLFKQLRTLRLIVILAGIFTVILLAAWPLLSADLFLYIFYPKAVLVYGDNPYLAPLVTYSHDILASSGYVIRSWLPNPLAYGPAWLLLTLPFTGWGLSGVLPAMISFKLMAAVFLGASAWLLYKILCLTNPSRANIGTALLLWSPLVLLEIVNNGHNDIVMIFFLLAALYAAARKKYFWVLPLFTLSVFVKYITLLFLPFLLYYLWQQSAKSAPARRSLLWSVAVSVALTALLFAPFWGGLGTFKGLWLFNTSVYNYKGMSLMGILAKGVYRLWPAVQDLPELYFMQLVNRAMFIGLYGALWLMFRPRSFDDLIKAWCLVMTLFITVLTVYLQSWYLVLPIVLLLLARDWPLRWTLVLTLLGLLNYFYISADLTIVFFLFLALDWYWHKFFANSNYFYGK